MVGYQSSQRGVIYGGTLNGISELTRRGRPGQQIQRLRRRLEWGKRRREFEESLLLCWLVGLGQRNKGCQNDMVSDWDWGGSQNVLPSARKSRPLVDRAIRWEGKVHAPFGGMRRRRVGGGVPISAVRRGGRTM